MTTFWIIAPVSMCIIENVGFSSGCRKWSQSPPASFCSLVHLGAEDLSGSMISPDFLGG